jgi:hypothetical protein
VSDDQIAHAAGSHVREQRRECQPYLH